MKITDEALNQFKSAIEQFDKAGSGIRLFTTNGCCGPALQMSIENHLSAGEKMIRLNDIDFFIDPQAEKMLEGVTIDFRENSFRLDGLKRSGNCCG